MSVLEEYSMHFVKVSTSYSYLWDFFAQNWNKLVVFCQ